MSLKYILTYCLISLLIIFNIHGRDVQKINQNWSFNLCDTPEAKSANFDDSNWRVLNLPHDWAIEGKYDRLAAQGERGGYLPGGIAWYRKTIELSEKDIKDKLFSIDFDAIYMNSEVWINGSYLGKRPYGYISFGYDLTEYIKPGKNVISVRVDNSLEPSARWYHGCGIYGNAYLTSTSRIYVKKWSPFIQTTLQEANTGLTNASATIVNKSNKKDKLKIKLEIIDNKGVAIGTTNQTVTIEPSQELDIKLSINIPNANLWDIDNPILYDAKITVLRGKTIVDTYTQRYGYRSIEWKPETGFWLNGNNVKLRGVCEHLEGGPMGAAYTRQMMRWKLQLIKDMGCNAIRVAHNPQVPEFYELCDEMGILVMDEIFDGWSRKAAYDYGQQAFAEWWEKDLRDWVRRDRNHPSIIIYSLGNETEGEIAKELVRVCNEEDPTRLTTSGDSSPNEMTVYGVNGRSEKKGFIEGWNVNKKAFVGTETPHTWQVRGYYRTQTWYRDGYPNKSQDPYWYPNLTENEIFGYDWTSPKKRRNKKQIFNSSYDNATVRITARQNIAILRDSAWYSGHFRWTGFDYLGEAGYVHGGWPFRAFMGGALDLAGFKKDLFYLYQSQWTDRPMMHILPHWTHPTMKLGTEIPVWIYSNCEEVELFLNGRSLGRIKPGKEWDKMQCEWMVPWMPGEIKAIGYINGQEVLVKNHKTADYPTQLSVVSSTDNLLPDAEEIAIVTIEQLDGNGVFYPYGENKVKFVLTGPAKIKILENGNPVDTTPNFGVDERRTFFGLTRAFIQSTNEEGDISLMLAAISGDKALMVSNKVSIDIKNIALRGALPKNSYTIYYTLDGTEPTKESKLYIGAFEVNPKTTVKAAIFDNNKRIAILEETFGMNDGIYWGTPGEPIMAISGEQADEALLSGGALLSNKGNGYIGNNYIVFGNNKGASAEWYIENDGGNKSVNLTIDYSLQTTEKDCQMEISNNKGDSQLVTFKNTGSFDSNWTKTTIQFPIYKGGNNITIKAIGEINANINRIILQD